MKTKALNSFVINFQGDTLQDLLRHIAFDYATYGFFPIHAAWALDLQVKSFRRIHPEFVRLGEADTSGYSPFVAISKDWTFDNTALIERALIDEINVWNADSEALTAQVELAGGISQYQGQVFTYWGAEQGYPLCPYHSVLSAMKTEDGIQKHYMRQTQKGTVAKQAFIYKDKFENKKEEDAVYNMLQTLQGPEGGDIALIHGVGEDGLSIQQLKHDYADGFFSQTSNDTRKAIMQAFGQPASLHSEFREGALGGTGEVEMGYKYYNAKTQKLRAMVSRQLEKIFAHFSTPLEGLEIKPLEFEGIDSPINIDPNANA